MSRGIGATENDRVRKPLTPTVPEAWTQVDFEQAFDTVSVNNKKVPAKTYLSEGLFPVIDQGQAFIGGYTNDSTKAIDPGEDGLIVFGDHTRIFKRVTFPFAPGADGTKILRPTLSSSAYAYYACLSLQFPNKGYSRHYSYLCKCKFPVAPKTEQTRIVSKIDELFSEIEEGERALERVRKLVERHRQSVLKAAVTGELTREWREKHKGQIESGGALLQRILKARREAWGTNKYREPALQGVADLPDLPKGWVWASVEQLCSEFGNGLSRKPAEKPPGIPILRISAVRAMRVNGSDIRYYVPERSEALEAFQVQSGDLLFTRYNGSKELVGVSGVYRGIDPVLHPDKLIKARVVSIEHVIPEYLALSLNCGESWRHITGWVKTSAGQHGIAGSDIKRTPIPLPPFAEQREIVDVVERAAFKCDEALSACSAELRRASALRQSTLQFAFSGKLVEQDPSDERASALLERIAAERMPSAITRTRSRRQRRTA